MLALQCRTRVKIAKKELKALMGEQKDIGKLRDNNEKLKQEMQSLKAMLSAQAKEGAASAAHEKEIKEKQDEIDALEKRVAELEKQLATEQALIEKLETDLKAQKQAAMDAKINASMNTSSHHHPPGSPRSPTGKKRTVGQSPHVRTNSADVDGALQMPNLPSNYVSPEIVAQHKAKLGRLEEELKAERKLRREADGEIIKLRAQINGVKLNDGEVDALLAQKLETTPKVDRYVHYPFRIFIFYSVCWPERFFCYVVV